MTRSPTGTETSQAPLEKEHGGAVRADSDPVGQPDLPHTGSRASRGNKHLEWFQAGDEGSYTEE